MKGKFRTARSRWLAALVVLATTLGGDEAGAAVDLVRAAGAFDRSQFTVPEAAADVRRAGDLKGTHCCVAGWAEYDFDITTGGWYQLWLEGTALETLVDMPESGDGEPAAYFSGGSGVPGTFDKIGNVWLDPGRHRVRLQDYRWYGFSGVKTLELRRSGGAIDGAVAITWPRAGQIFRAGQCPSFQLQWGGGTAPTHLDIEVRDRNSGTLAGATRLSLPTRDGLARQEFSVPCTTEGSFHVSVAEVRDGTTREIDWRGIKGFDFDVIDTAPRSPDKPTRAAIEVLDIDCASEQPQFESGDSRVRETPLGRYRQSGDSGWMPQWKLPGHRAGSAEPSWFAYTLAGVRAGRPYRIAVDYPDDEDRIFAAVVRESRQHAYPLAIGMDTGGPYPLSHALQTARMTVWPRAADPRLLFMPPHDGSTAACSRIRVWELDPTEPSGVANHPADGRQFVFWYEEGINFIDLFGAASEDPTAVARAIDRWVAISVEEGATTLMPTALVYGDQLYPSRFNLMQMFPDKDPLRRLMLRAEASHIRVIPELHPRADELMYGKSPGAARRLLLVSKDGGDSFLAPDGHTRNIPPHYNALLPDVQAWFVDMVAELADRYRDSPAFEGISLRYMPWSNAALDNLVDLDWGYDDTTVSRFLAETGVAIPGESTTAPDRFARRHAWLTGPGREAWVRWRCAQVTALVDRIARRLRAARPDLRLFIHVFPSDPERPYAKGDRQRPPDTPRTRLLEAGLDVSALADLTGVVLIDSSVSYGRDRPGAVAKGLLEPLRDPDLLQSLRTGAGLNALPAHRYLEATDKVVPPALLGFPEGTKATWTSVAANGAGRNALERFALGLAVGDALLLGDGGNGNVYGVPGLRPFLADYTKLPAVNFRTESAPDDAVVVRTHAQPGAWWLYAVNRSNAVACVQLPIQGAGPLTRLADGKEIARTGPLLVFQLAPYELIALRGDEAHRLDRQPAATACEPNPDRYRSGRQATEG